MTAGAFAGFSTATCRFSVGRAFVCRALLVALLVIVTHQFAWGWLRFLTSEAVLRLSASLGLGTQRVSADTIRVQGDLFRFVISCTFVDVVMGAIPLVWNLKKTISKNLLTVIALALSLFGFNVVRLEIGQLLYAYGAPWSVADDVLGGASYFAVWLLIVH